MKTFMLDGVGEVQSVLSDNTRRLPIRRQFQNRQDLQCGPGQSAELGCQNVIPLARCRQQLADFPCAPIEPARCCVFEDGIWLDALCPALLQYSVLLIISILRVGRHSQVDINCH